MSEDVAPKLIDSVNNSFEKNYNKDIIIQKTTKKLDNEVATLSDAYDYALSVGNARAKAFKSEISSDVLPDGRMYYNIADRLLTESLTTDHELITEYTSRVQQAAIEKTGLNLKAQKPEIDKDRIKGFVNRLSSEENYDKVSWILDEPIKVHAMSVVDDTVKKNAEFQNKAGLKATVIREAAADCCAWCNDLAGEYVYPKVPRDVFARHDNCRCTLDYEGRRLSAYTSNFKSHSFRDLGEQEKIENRRNYEKDILNNLSTRDNFEVQRNAIQKVQDDFLISINQHPSILGSYTPETLKEKLEDMGFTVTALSRGNLKKISFEDGGGYKVNYGGDGILQYHPQNKSHHDIEYYKISSGKKGIRRYDRYGHELAK